MTNLNKVREFAMNNPIESEIGFDYEGTWVVNPWYDITGRFYLNDEEMVAEYGLTNILAFIDMVEKEMERGDNMQNDFQKGLDELLAKTELPAPKQTFIVDIEETIVKGFVVEATDMAEAMEIAEEKYFNGDFVLGGDADVAYRQMRASTEDFKETTEWIEF